MLESVAKATLRNFEGTGIGAHLLSPNVGRLIQSEHESALDADIEQRVTPQSLNPFPLYCYPA